MMPLQEEAKTIDSYLCASFREMLFVEKRKSRTHCSLFKWGVVVLAIGGLGLVGCASSPKAPGGSQTPIYAKSGFLESYDDMVLFLLDGSGLSRTYKDLTDLESQRQELMREREAAEAPMFYLDRSVRLDQGVLHVSAFSVKGLPEQPGFDPYEVSYGFREILVQRLAGSGLFREVTTEKRKTTAAAQPLQMSGAFTDFEIFPELIGTPRELSYEPGPVPRTTPPLTSYLELKITDRAQGRVVFKFRSGFLITDRTVWIPPDLVRQAMNLRATQIVSTLSTSTAPRRQWPSWRRPDLLR